VRDTAFIHPLVNTRWVAIADDRFFTDEYAPDGSGRETWQLANGVCSGGTRPDLGCGYGPYHSADFHWFTRPLSPAVRARSPTNAFLLCLNYADEGEDKCRRAVIRLSEARPRNLGRRDFILEFLDGHVRFESVLAAPERPSH
jgi:hypothetical protein